MVVRPLQAFGSSDIPRSVPRASTAGPDRGLDLHGVSTECRPDMLLWTIMLTLPSARHAVPGLVITVSWLCFSRSMVAIVGGLWLSSPCYRSIAPSILGCSNKVGFPLRDFVRCSSFYRYFCWSVRCRIFYKFCCIFLVWLCTTLIINGDALYTQTCWIVVGIW
jgi:hypothetical protein